MNAPELADVQSWREAMASRRDEIGRAIAGASGALNLSYSHSHRFIRNGPPIATFVHRYTGANFRLLPGGTYLRGLSEREESELRSAAAREPAETRGGEFGTLFSELHLMRPVRSVSVQPFLLESRVAMSGQPFEAAGALSASHFRLPSEAEHEFAQRGLIESQLCWRCDAVPDERVLTDIRESKTVNVYGLSGLGLEPELTSDLWSRTYEGAPDDGRPRTGVGPRVTRGGAAVLHPWQGCGEWHYLLNACRQSSASWRSRHAIRFAVGIRLL